MLISHYCNPKVKLDLIPSGSCECGSWASRQWSISPPWVDSSEGPNQVNRAHWSNNENIQNFFETRINNNTEKWATPAGWNSAYCFTAGANHTTIGLDCLSEHTLFVGLPRNGSLQKGVLFYALGSFCGLWNLPGASLLLEHFWTSILDQFGFVLKAKNIGLGQLEPPLSYHLPPSNPAQDKLYDSLTVLCRALSFCSSIWTKGGGGASPQSVLDKELKTQKQITLTSEQKNAPLEPCRPLFKVVRCFGRWSAAATMAWCPSCVWGTSVCVRKCWCADCAFLIK